MHATHACVDVAEENGEEQIERHELPQADARYEESGVPIRPAAPDAVVHDLIPGKCAIESKKNKTTGYPPR